MSGRSADASDPKEVEARTDHVKVILLGDSAVGKSKYAKDTRDMELILSDWLNVS